MHDLNDLDWRSIERLIQEAIAEDLDKTGDITTISTVDKRVITKAELIAKQPGVVAGLQVAEKVFQSVDAHLECYFQIQDGQSVKADHLLGKVSGPVQGLLSAERTALNFLQHLSGIATLTSEFVRRVYGTGVQILDTRKTLPGLRILEKYAVRMGGGANHRFGLYDMVLIKNNHIDAAGGLGLAVRSCLEYLEKNRLNLRIEVETRTLDEVREALDFPIHRIMLDNMDTVTMKKAVDLAEGRVEMEASGNIQLENVRTVAETGVDFISVGNITHSAPALDISLHVCQPIV